VTTTRPSSRELTGYQSVWQIASVLLAYPDPGLLANVALLSRMAARLPTDQGTPLVRFLDHIATQPLLDLEAHYVETFDHRRRCCLYLTYYAHGDTRKRGMALLQFKSAYRAAALELGTDELPDHLSVVLEFAASADAAAGRQLLLDHRAGLELLRLALGDARSPYVDVIRAVSATLPPLSGDDREAVSRLAAEGPPVEEVGLQPFAPPDYMPQTEGVRR
jgi:nitrate reductase delta subunit